MDPSSQFTRTAMDASSSSRESLAALNGEEVTKAVPKEFWCITKKDLLKFRKEVGRLTALGLIKPTQRDPFNPSDNVIGPSIYTVNEQMIVPVTHQAGNCSWALMCNPKGGKCDLFITHGWQEGIYEFIDKVLNSWPLGAQYAYCCMLSNPQNLDIQHLIKSPSDSPFAHALRSAIYVMVVANSKGSIYTRIWCVYEAYLGYVLNKHIFTAHSLEWKHIGWSGVFTAMETDWFSQDRFGSCWEGFNFVGIAVCIWLYICAFLFCVLDDGRIAFYVRYAALLTVLFLLALDTYERGEGVRKANRQLQFTGHVADAESSREEDKRSIMAEIHGNLSDIDATIQLLLETGVSTNDLRSASRLGVGIPQGGIFCPDDPNTLLFFATLVLYYLSSRIVFKQHHLYYGCFSTFCICAWAYMYLVKLQHTRKSFAGLSGIKIMGLWLMFGFSSLSTRCFFPGLAFGWITVACLGNWEALHGLIYQQLIVPHDQLLVMWYVSLSVGTACVFFSSAESSFEREMYTFSHLSLTLAVCVAFAVSALGPDGVARMPGLGVYLATFLIAPPHHIFSSERKFARNI